MRIYKSENEWNQSANFRFGCSEAHKARVESGYIRSTQLLSVPLAVCVCVLVKSVPLGLSEPFDGSWFTHRDGVRHPVKAPMVIPTLSLSAVSALKREREREARPAVKKIPAPPLSFSIHKPVKAILSILLLILWVLPLSLSVSSPHLFRLKGLSALFAESLSSRRLLQAPLKSINERYNALRIFWIIFLVFDNYQRFSTKRQKQHRV